MKPKVYIIYVDDKGETHGIRIKSPSVLQIESGSCDVIGDELPKEKIHLEARFEIDNLTWAWFYQGNGKNFRRFKKKFDGVMIYLFGK